MAVNGQTIRTITIRGTSEGLDKVTGDLNKLAAAQTNVAVVSEQSAKRVLSLEDAWKRQTLKLDEAARAQANIARETKVADAALREGLATQAQHAQRLDQINQRYAVATQSTQKFTEQSGLARHELINLGRQAQDVGVSLISGQSPFMVLAQQGSQIADVFISSGKSVGGFFSQAIGWAGRFAASTTGVVTGIGGIAVGVGTMVAKWQEGQRDIDMALVGIGKRAGATRGEINLMAADNAVGAKLSVAEWQKGAIEFAKTGTIYKENFAGLNNLVKGFAVTIGESSDEAQKQLAKIFSGDVTAAADQLNKIYGTISEETRKYAGDLEAAGKRQQALSVIIKEITPAIQDAAKHTGFWAVQWNALSTDVSNATDRIGKAFAAMTGIGDTPNEELKRVRAELDTTRESLSRGGPSQAGAIKAPRSVLDLGKPEANIGPLMERAAALEGQLKKLEDNQAFLKLGQDAGALTRAILPSIEQTRELTKAVSTLEQHKAALESRGMKVSPEEKAALTVAKAQLAIAKEVVGVEEMKAQVILDNAQQYSNVGTIGAQILKQQEFQLAGAQAVGQEAQLQAQYEATIYQAKQQTGSLTDAIVIAEKQREITLAQIATQHQKTMDSLQGQLSVAQAGIGLSQQEAALAQIQAQYQATIVNLRNQDFSLAQATAQADLQRQTALAGVQAAQDQINRGAQQTLANLQAEGAALQAGSTQYANQIRAIAQKNQLIQQGVDANLAGSIASQTFSNAETQRHNKEAEAEKAAIAGIKDRADAWRAYAAESISWSVANDEAGKANARNAEAASEAAREAYIAQVQARREMTRMNEEARKFTGILTDWHYQWATLAESISDVFSNLQEGKDIWTVGGRVSQFNPAGYASGTSLLGPLEEVYGQGNVDPKTGMPNAQGLMKVFTNRFNTALTETGGNLFATVGKVISGGVFTGGETDPQKLQLLNRAVDLMPKDQQISTIQSLLGQLGTVHGSLETAELTKQLNDKLTELTKAVEDNTTAMTDVLSPLYSTDPRQTHLGFRSFAGGGIMTAYGELPLRQYQGGGMATTPQVAVFGEGSTAEAYVPVPSGRIPVELKTPANNNQKQRPVTVNINIMGNADAGTVAALKQTSFQQAQAMRRVVG